MAEGDAGIEPKLPGYLPAEHSASPAAPPIETTALYPIQSTRGPRLYGPQTYTPPTSPPDSPPTSPPYSPPTSPPDSPPTSPPYSPPTSPPYWPPAVPPPGRAQFPASSWGPSPGSWGAPTFYPATGWGYVPGYGPGFGPGFAPVTAPGYTPLPYAPPGPMPGLLWGGIRVRLGALVIDAVLLVCSLFAMGLVVASIGGGSASRTGNTAATAVALVWWLFVLVYNPACWYIFGATPGQKALGLRVAQASDGQSLGIGAVLVRYLIFFMVTLAFPLGVVSAAIASKDPFKRAWHDDLARSVVVRK
jgi:hypothetical protein